MASIKRVHHPFLSHKISALTHVEQSGKCIYQRLADSPLTEKNLLKNGLLAFFKNYAASMSHGACLYPKQYSIAGIEILKFP